MTFEEILDQAVAMLQRRGRVTYRALKAQFQLDEDLLETLKDELLFTHPVADEGGRGLVWTGEAGAPVSTSQPDSTLAHPTAQLDQPTRVEPPLESRSREAERRQLTVMFCDLVDSTKLSLQLDPEDYRDVVREYQQVCSEVIQRYDGHVAQLLGDGLLVYFGYPVAHEEDAQRAVHTGLGIIAAIESLNTRLEQSKGVRLAIRLGVHTGLVVIGEMGGEGRQEQLALGEVPNIASRLEGLAAPNTVALSDVTYRLIQGYFECETLGEQMLRGLADPIAVYRVLSESGAQSRLDVVSTRGLTPLVGREQEVGLLFEHWAQAKDSNGQVVLLSGEAGIGKSRLVQVLKDHAKDEPHAQLECRGSPYHTNSAFYPLAELLQRKLGWQPEDTADEKLHKLETALAQTHLDVNTAVPLFTALLSLPLPDDRYPPIQLSSQQQRQQTLEAFLQIVLLASEQHPVLFIVEDLHWVDPSTLEFLELLMDQTPMTAIFVLFTSRPEVQPTWAHRSYLTEVSLSRLSRHQVEQMTTQVASGKALPAEVVEQLVDKTDGVPLYVEEMTKSVLESGVLKETNGHYELSGPITSLAIPATLQDSLMARLDRLMTAKVVAQLGATMGRQFEYELLQAVAQLDEPTLQRELGRLVEAELIHQRGLPPNATYTFKHALVQDTAYESLLRSTRQGYHRRIAEVLEEQFPETAKNQPELLAHHFTEAGLNGQAVEYWHQAGQRAVQRSANMEAISHLEKGLELLHALPDTSERTQQELGVHLTLGFALQASKGSAAPEVETTYTRAWQLCHQLGETSQLFQVLHGLWSHALVRAEYQRANELVEQSLHLAQGQLSTVHIMQIHDKLGNVLFWRGELRLAQAHFAQTMALDDPQQRRSPDFQLLRLPCLFHTAWVQWTLGYPEQALQSSHAAFTLAKETSHPFGLAFALNQSARLHQFRREVQWTQERAEASIQLSTAQGFAQQLAGATFLRGWALSQQGQYEQGVTEMHQGLTAYRAIGVEHQRTYFLALLAEGYGRVEQLEEGLTILAEALALVDKNGERVWEAELHRLKGELLLQQSSDNIAEAESCFHQAITIAQKQQAKSLELRAATSLARLWQSHGKRQEAYELLAPLYNWFTEGFDTADLQEARALLNELAG